MINLATSNRELAAPPHPMPVAVATPMAQDATRPRERRNSLSTMIRLTKQMTRPHSHISSRAPATNQTSTRSPKLISTSLPSRSLLMPKPLTHRTLDPDGPRSLNQPQRNNQKRRRHNGRQQQLMRPNFTYPPAIR